MIVQAGGRMPHRLDRVTANGLLRLEGDVPPAARPHNKQKPGGKAGLVDLLNSLCTFYLTAK